MFYLLLFAVLVFPRRTNSYGFQKIFVTHSSSSEPFLGILSSYSSELDASSSVNGQLITHPTDTYGCSLWTLDSNEFNDQMLFGIIDRGICTFAEKTKFAQKSGISILIIVNNDHTIEGMGSSSSDFDADIGQKDIIPTLMVSHEFKERLLNFDQSEIEESFINHSIFDPSLTITVFEHKYYDTSMMIMIAVATLLVGMGAYYSSDEERANYKKSGTKMRRRQPIQEIDSFMAWTFIGMASFSLLTMYFFVEYIFIFVLIVFCIGATNGLSTILSHIIDHYWPYCSTLQFYISIIDINITLSDIISFIPSSAISIIWYLTRTADYAWILQDVMCCGLLMVLQRSIRMSSLKIASILLICAFFYDIFWVFLSPYFFAQSVMVEVATYAHHGSPRDTLPVMLKFPKIHDPWHSPMILGLGDIALPGLLVSYLLRFDYQSNIDSIWNLSHGYFFPSLIGYCFGMVLTDINLILMEKGQPALLFLVPCTLGLVVVLAYKRGRLKQLWLGNAQYGVPLLEAHSLKNVNALKRAGLEIN